MFPIIAPPEPVWLRYRARRRELEELSQPDKDRLRDAVTVLSRPLMADGALRSRLASHLAIARR